MRKYEFALVLKESTGKDEAKLKKTATSLVEQVKGKITKSNILGVRQFAYMVKKQSKGSYGIFKVELPENSIGELDKQIRLNEEILRYLLVKEE